MMLEIYTDGSSLGNPGPGGWGFLVVENNKIIIEKSGGEKNTTNNRMELTAVIETFKYLNLRKSDFRKFEEIKIHTDSAYVLGGVTSWIKNWERNGWRTANKKQVLNQDLWKELDELIKNFKGKISWQKVKGHSGHIHNDRADEIATQKALLQK
jgi:ribonuclease HI